jgi:hypothetical protein
MKHTNKLWLIAIIGIIALAFIACNDGPEDSKTQIAKPALETVSFEYDGNEKTVTLTATNAAYTLGGVFFETEVGNYTAIVTLTDTGKFEWTDGTTAPLNLDWSITTQSSCDCDTPCTIPDCDCPECPGNGEGDECECSDPCTIPECPCPDCTVQAENVSTN